MRLTIIKSDDTVSVDGVPRTLDLSGYASLNGLHAVQWNETIGHIEFDNSTMTRTTFKVNEEIMTIEPYADIVKAWYDAGPHVEPIKG